MKDPIKEANERAQEEMRREPSPFHDKYFAKTPIGDLTTEQLQQEIDRRNSFAKMFILVRVIGTLGDGTRKDRLHWEYQDVDPDSFSASHNSDFIDIRAKRLPRTKQ